MTVREFSREVGSELRPTLRLAGPVVLAELGWMAMGVVDTLSVGSLGAEAIGAVSLGGMAFFSVAVFGMGLLLGLDTLVAQAFGARDLPGCHRALAQGLILSLALTPPLMAASLLMPWLLAQFGVEPRILSLAIPYVRVSAASMAPLLIFAATRRYLQAMGIVRPVTFALVSANLVNAMGNWAFVHGHLGAPALGATGSAWATLFSRVYMCAFLLIYMAWDARARNSGLFQVSWRPDLALLGLLTGLGLPAALHVTLEVGVFAVATALAARMDAASLAAHQIVLNISSVTFMVPFGLASAGAVRVGHAIGRGDPAGAARAGWTTLTLGVGFMLLAGLAFCAAPGAILGAFTDDPRVLATGISLLFVAAGFQLFDALQGVTAGNLRGAGDTRTAMTTNLIAHWGFGLPIGCALAFGLNQGVLGLWAGLFLGLSAAGTFLLGAWVARTRKLARSASA